MKAKTLSVLAGVSAPLILTGSVSAGFVGIKVVQKTEAEAFGLFVCNVYAVFDRPDDEMIVVAGTLNNPLNIFVKQGKFYQDPQGASLTAPFLEFLPGASGILANDLDALQKRQKEHAVRIKVGTLTTSSKADRVVACIEHMPKSGEVILRQHILLDGLPHHLCTKVPAEITRCSEINLPADQLGELPLQCGNAYESDTDLREELHQHIHIAIRSKVATKCRPEQ